MPRQDLLLPLIFTFALLLSLAAAGNVVYVKSVSSPNMRSSFQIPSSPAGGIITAYINQNGGSSIFTVVLWNSWQTYPTGTPEDTATLKGSSTYTSPALKLSGAYRIEVLPSSSSFAFSIQIQVNNITVGTYADVARYDRIFAYYHSSMGTYQVTVNGQSAKAKTDLSVKVFGPFSSLTISGGSQVAGGPAGTTLSYTSNGNQYYYIVIRASDSLMKTN